MSSRVVKSASEMSTIAAIFDCYTIIRLQNNNTTWKTIPFMGKRTGLATVNVEDAHIVNLDYSTIEIKDELKIKKTNIYTLSKPGLFLDVLTILFKHMFSEFEVLPSKKTSGPMTTEYFINKIVKRDFLLSQFFDNTLIENDETSKQLWESLKEINEHKLVLMISLISVAKGDFIKSDQRELLNECGMAILRFIFFMTGFFSIKFEINWEPIKADTLIATIKGLHYLNIININRNKSSTCEHNKTLSFMINVSLDKDRSEREIRAKKAADSKKAKAQTETSDVVQSLLSMAEPSSDDESEEETPRTNKTSIFNRSTVDTVSTTKVEMMTPKFVEPPSINQLVEFSFVPAEQRPVTNEQRPVITEQKPVPTETIKKNSKPEVKKTVKSIKTKEETKTTPSINLGEEINDDDISFMLTATQEYEDSLKGENQSIGDEEQSDEQ